jgi:prolyl 4-hydroxylase
MPRLGLFPIIQLLFASSCRCYCHALKLTSLLGSQFDAAPPGGDDSPNDAVSDSPSYGVDCSFPIQHDVLLHDGPFDHEERRLLYDGFMKGCIAQETAAQNYESRCDQAEAERIATNLFQPSKMVNYTQLGYEKVPVPGKLLQSLKIFWKKRHQSHRHHPPTSNFEIGTTYINHWHTHFHIMNVDDELYQSKHLRTQIWDETKPILEKWTGVELSPSSMFGVSIFTDKTVVPHRVESLPFVISAIIHVADDLDTPWPIELYGHDGKAHNVTLDVGEMLLYESASVITGRPYPLQGRHYAEIFISFEPFGYSCHHEQRHSLLDDVAEESLLSTLYLDSWWMWALGRFYKAHKAVVPTYIDKNFDAYSRWYQSYPRAKLVSQVSFVFFFA